MVGKEANPYEGARAAIARNDMTNFIHCFLFLNFGIALLDVLTNELTLRKRGPA
jgi:hypothetical protein